MSVNFFIIKIQLVCVCVFAFQKIYVLFINLKSTSYLKLNTLDIKSVMTRVDAELMAKLIVNSSGKTHERLQHCYHNSNDPFQKANDQCTAPTVNCACIRSVFATVLNLPKGL
jgi:hypothetical protein